MKALAVCKIYNPTIKPDLLVGGFPAMRADGCKFVREDYQRAVEETRVYATLIADDVNVEVFEPGYDEHNNRRMMPAPVAISLKSAGSKRHHTGPAV